MNRQTKINIYTKNASNIYREEFLNSLIITFDKDHKFYYVIFTGKRSKPSYYNSSGTKEYRTINVNAAKEKIKENHERMLKYLEGRKIEADSIQADTILYSDWGYEQTNINFYLVLTRKNSTVTVQEIGKNREFQGQDYGTCTPNKEIKIGEPFKKRITKHGTIKINEVYDASKYKGEKLHWSSYY